MPAQPPRAGSTNRKRSEQSIRKLTLSAVLRPSHAEWAVRHSRRTHRHHCRGLTRFRNPARQRDVGETKSDIALRLRLFCKVKRDQSDGFVNTRQPNTRQPGSEHTATGVEHTATGVTSFYFSFRHRGGLRDACCGRRKMRGLIAKVQKAIGKWKDVTLCPGVSPVPRRITLCPGVSSCA